MYRILVACVLSIHLFATPVKAQQLISEAGRFVFFNTLDSTESMARIHLVLLLDCYLSRVLPKDSTSINLDIAFDPDTAYFRLSHDNLFGNAAQFADSSRVPSDPGQQVYAKHVGLRLVARGQQYNEEALLKILEWGLTHLAELGTKNVDDTGLAGILNKPLEKKNRALLNSCTFATHL